MDDTQENEEVLSQYIKYGEALKELKEDPNFKLLITEGYIENNSKSSIDMLSIPQVIESGERPQIIERLIAVSHLTNYLKYVADSYEYAISPKEGSEDE
ncbi:hypothetical protein [Candidatus Macondimonas diazotrophica]|jgi:hypothetical protein|uniref:Uncharacterized protein n=1 Tax=Candidatus Macondimonas diazotrophica TaxID=2305248 RepID=A0A4Z0F5G0_9GAMM|nr:hypothetical protein [Candidatus Macondimonas diazotrophica]TFZ81487.1 hypothetical protein E4680_12465 [Candidatus Macondimonas diazotrophica]